MTKKEQYLAAGLELMPSGRINEHRWQKYCNGGVSSMKDSSWVRTGTGKHGRIVGYHRCCGSKRSYRHKVGCLEQAKLRSDDLSDLKDL